MAPWDAAKSKAHDVDVRSGFQKDSKHKLDEGVVNACRLVTVTAFPIG
jgi:hypothetical protein